MACAVSPTSIRCQRSHQGSNPGTVTCLVLDVVQVHSRAECNFIQVSNPYRNRTSAEYIASNMSGKRTQSKGTFEEKAKLLFRSRRTENVEPCGRAGKITNFCGDCKVPGSHHSLFRFLFVFQLQYFLKSHGLGDEISYTKRNRLGKSEMSDPESFNYAQLLKSRLKKHNWFYPPQNFGDITTTCN